MAHADDRAIVNRAIVEWDAFVRTDHVFHASIRERFLKRCKPLHLFAGEGWQVAPALSEFHDRTGCGIAKVDRQPDQAGFSSISNAPLFYDAIWNEPPVDMPVLRSEAHNLGILMERADDRNPLQAAQRGTVTRKRGQNAGHLVELSNLGVNWAVHTGRACWNSAKLSIVKSAKFVVASGGGVWHKEGMTTADPVVTKATCERCAGTGHKIDDVKTGRAMAALRQKAAKRQSDVAAHMGLTESYISNLEKGMRAWTKELMDGYLAALG